MILCTGLQEKIKTGLWTKCAATVTKLENIMVKPHKEKCAYEKFYIIISEYAKHLRIFGEMGVAYIIATLKAKLED